MEILCHLDEMSQDRYVSSYHRALAQVGYTGTITFEKLFR